MAQIIPIKELKNTANISELCHSTEGPIFVTKNGYGDMVIMSMETFHVIEEKLKMYQSVLASMKEIEEGETMDAKLSLNQLKEKYGL